MQSWFWIPFEILMNMIEIGFTIHLANGLFHKNRMALPSKWVMAAFTAFGTCWLSLYLFFDSIPIPSILSGVLVFFTYATICLHAAWYSALIWSLINVLVLGIIAYSFPLALGAILDQPFEVFYTYTDSRILSIVLGHIVWIVMIVFAVKTVDRRRTLQFMKKGRLLFLTMPLFSVFLIFLLMSYQRTTLEQNMLSLFSVITGVGLLVINIGTLLLHDRMTLQAEQTILLQTQYEIERVQIHHHEELKELYQNIQKFRHDFNNHMHVLQGMVQMGKFADLQSYVQRMSSDLASLTAFVSTGNIVVDALLGVYMGMAKSHEIHMCADAALPERLPVTNEHLAALLGNLLSNAYEACRRIPEEEKRFIALRMHSLKGNLCISIENATDGSEKKLGNRWVTTKKETQSHGFGLVSIDHIVNHYEGFCERRHENAVFSTSVVLPQLPDEPQ